MILVDYQLKKDGDEEPTTDFVQPTDIGIYNFQE